MKIIARVSIKGKSNHLKPELVLRQTPGGEYEFGLLFNDGRRMQPIERRISDLHKAVYRANRGMEMFGKENRIDLSSVQKELISKIL